MNRHRQHAFRKHLIRRARGLLHPRYDGTFDDETTLSESEQQQLSDIRLAIERIDHGVYGHCAGCVRPIGEQRLAEQPWTRFCARCVARRCAAVADPPTRREDMAHDLRRVGIGEQMSRRIELSAKHALLTRWRSLLQLRQTHQVDERELLSDRELDVLDTATRVENAQALDGLSEVERRELDEIRAALERIGRGTYGWCEQCSERVATRRLEAIPWARLCAECATERETALLRRSRRRDGLPAT